jgi:toxin CcdB
MARYDVYPSPGGAGFVVDVQTDLLDGLATRVVAPLLPVETAPKPAKLLNPVIDIGGEAHVLVTQFLAAVPTRSLGKPVGDVSARSDEINRALDMVFHGF